MISSILNPRAEMTVFVSYSHDSDAHRQRVKCVAERMKERGISVVTDLDCPDPNLGFIRWMEKQLEAGKPAVDSVAFATSQKMLAGDVVKRGRPGEPCAVYTEAVGQLPGEPRIKRLVAFAEAHGVFADHRDDFSLLDKIKQVFPEIVGPNRAHPLFVAGCQSAEPASVAS